MSGTDQNLATAVSVKSLSWYKGLAPLCSSFNQNGVPKTLFIFRPGNIETAQPIPVLAVLASSGLFTTKTLPVVCRETIAKKAANRVRETHAYFCADPVKGGKWEVVYLRFQSKADESLALSIISPRLKDGSKNSWNQLAKRLRSLLSPQRIVVVQVATAMVVWRAEGKLVEVIEAHSLKMVSHGETINAGAIWEDNAFSCVIEGRTVPIYESSYTCRGSAGNGAGYAKGHARSLQPEASLFEHGRWNVVVADEEKAQVVSSLPFYVKGPRANDISRADTDIIGAQHSNALTTHALDVQTETRRNIRDALNDLCAAHLGGQVSAVDPSREDLIGRLAAYNRHVVLKAEEAEETGKESTGMLASALAENVNAAVHPGFMYQVGLFLAHAGHDRIRRLSVELPGAFRCHPVVWEKWMLSIGINAPKVGQLSIHRDEDSEHLVLFNNSDFKNKIRLATGGSDIDDSFIVQLASLDEVARKIVFKKKGADITAWMWRQPNQLGDGVLFDSVVGADEIGAEIGMLTGRVAGRIMSEIKERRDRGLAIEYVPEVREPRRPFNRPKVVKHTPASALLYPESRILGFQELVIDLFDESDWIGVARQTNALAIAQSAIDGGYATKADEALVAVFIRSGGMEAEIDAMSGKENRQILAETRNAYWAAIRARKQVSEAFLGRLGNIALSDGKCPSLSGIIWFKSETIEKIGAAGRPDVVEWLGNIKTNPVVDNVVMFEHDHLTHAGTKFVVEMLGIKVVKDEVAVVADRIASDFHQHQMATFRLAIAYQIRWIDAFLRRQGLGHNNRDILAWFLDQYAGHEQLVELARLTRSIWSSTAFAEHDQRCEAIINQIRHLGPETMIELAECWTMMALLEIKSKDGRLACYHHEWRTQAAAVANAVDEARDVKLGKRTINEVSRNATDFLFNGHFNGIGWDEQSPEDFLMNFKLCRMPIGPVMKDAATGEPRRDGKRDKVWLVAGDSIQTWTFRAWNRLTRMGAIDGMEV